MLGALALAGVMVVKTPIPCQPVFGHVTLGGSLSKAIPARGTVDGVYHNDSRLQTASWRKPLGTTLTVVSLDGKAVAAIDLLAGDADMRCVTLPTGDSLTLNESGHINAPADYRFFGNRRMPGSGKTDVMLAYFKPDDIVLVLYFDGPGDGSLREILYGYREALVKYGVALDQP